MCDCYVGIDRLVEVCLDGLDSASGALPTIMCCLSLLVNKVLFIYSLYSWKTHIHMIILYILISRACQDLLFCVPLLINCGLW